MADLDDKRSAVLGSDCGWQGLDNGKWLNPVSSSVGLADGGIRRTHHG